MSEKQPETPKCGDLNENASIRTAFPKCHLTRAVRYMSEQDMETILGIIDSGQNYMRIYKLFIKEKLAEMEIGDWFVDYDFLEYRPNCISNDEFIANYRIVEDKL